MRITARTGPACSTGDACRARSRRSCVAPAPGLRVSGASWVCRIRRTLRSTSLVAPGGRCDQGRAVAGEAPGGRAGRDLHGRRALGHGYAGRASARRDRTGLAGLDRQALADLARSERVGRPLQRAVGPVGEGPGLQRRRPSRRLTWRGRPACGYVAPCGQGRPRSDRRSAPAAFRRSTPHRSAVEPSCPGPGPGRRPARRRVPPERRPGRPASSHRVAWVWSWLRFLPRAVVTDSLVRRRRGELSGKANFIF
jgi:hypothetical protein